MISRLHRLTTTAGCIVVALLSIQTRAFRGAGPGRILSHFPRSAGVSRQAYSRGELESLGAIKHHNSRGALVRMMSSVGGGGGGGIDNPMNPQTYTEKAFDSIAKLPQYCSKYSTQAAESPILLRALYDDGPGGLFQRILQKAGVEPAIFDRSLEDWLKRQPKVSDTSNPTLGRSALDCLTKASNKKRDFGDQFISVEHLVLAAAEADPAKKIFAESGTTVQKLQKA
jgi:Clp amino terminal domain, pathogenicity island component